MPRKNGILIALALFGCLGLGMTMTARAVGATALAEPTTMLLLGTGLVGVAAGIRRRRKGKS